MAAFTAVIHSGHYDGTFDPISDIVPCAGTVQLAVLRTHYHQQLLAQGVAAEQARQRTAQVRGALLFATSKYQELTEANSERGDQLLRLLHGECRFRFGQQLTGGTPGPAAAPRRPSCRPTPVRAQVRADRVVAQVEQYREQRSRHGYGKAGGVRDFGDSGGSGD